MFDFVMLEEWWIETMIAALVSGICGIVVALIALTPKLNQILERLSDGAGCGNLSNWQTKLSSEHTRLSKENGQIIATISYLRDEQLKAEARRDALQSERLDMEKTIMILSSMQTRLDQYQQKIAELSTENERLKERLAHWEHQYSHEQEDCEPEL